jgi:phosphoribosyl 1,2-cyclic phosphodiesterase
MDHIVGVGFFAPLYKEGMDVHIWGPPSATMNLRSRLARYLSPPLFPVRIRDLPCSLTLHDLLPGDFTINEFRISADLVSHPGPTLAFRISENGGALTYMPDHEPVLGSDQLPAQDDWTSGFALAQGADVLIHDSQYSATRGDRQNRLAEQYSDHIGWGHCPVELTLQYADRARVGKLITFHHDPAHDDAQLDSMLQDALSQFKPECAIQPGQEGAVIDI